MPKPISIGLSPAHWDPNSFRHPSVSSPKPKNREKQAVMRQEFTLCCGWSILPGPQLSLLVDLSPPAGVTTRPTLSKPSDVSRSRDYREPTCPFVNMSLQSSFKWDVRVCGMLSISIHLASVTDNALKAASVAQNHALNAFTNAAERRIQQYCSIRTAASTNGLNCGEILTLKEKISGRRCSDKKRQEEEEEE